MKRQRVNAKPAPAHNNLHAAPCNSASTARPEGLLSPSLFSQRGEGDLFGAPFASWCAARLLPIVCVLIAGCVGPRPLHGGKAETTRGPAGTLAQKLVQGDNPAQESRQQQESLRVRNYTLPAGARLEETTVQTRGSGAPMTNVHAIVLNAPMPVTEREESRTAAELGASQKDTARELGARLASLRGITWLGAALFVFGLSSLFWPPLKLVIGSVTTSAAIAAGGLILLILPTLIAGNELLILSGVGLAIGAWFLAHRHGQLRGQLSASSVLASPPTATPAPQPGSASPIKN
ncbi:MAG TPA: hypothetical protein VFE51_03585 [Verrucomicrobiae bacterium]|nr:hypothetical protein [Verrucomicrobiae bacterium]